MLIDRLLRDRVQAVQSGPSDMGLFGATPGTFHSWSHDSALSVSLGAAGATGGDADTLSGGYAAHGNSITLGGEVALSGSTAGLLMPQLSGTLTAAPALTLHTATITIPLQVADHSIPIPISFASGAELRSDVHVEAQAASPSTTAPAAPSPPAADPAPARPADLVEEARTQAVAQLEQISSAVAQQLAAFHAQTQAVIAGLTEKTAAGIETGLETVRGAVGEIATNLHTELADITNSLTPLHVQAGALLSDLTAPVLGAVAALPLPDLSPQNSDLDLPLLGSDIAGGVDTLLGMLGGQSGFTVSDPLTGNGWSDVGANTESVLQTLSNDLLPDLGADQHASPGVVLLGVVDHAADLLPFDDHAHG